MIHNDRYRFTDRFDSITVILFEKTFPCDRYHIDKVVRQFWTHDYGMQRFSFIFILFACRQNNSQIFLL